MVMTVAMEEPLDPAKAKQLVRTILQSGTVSYSKHACEEMVKDGLQTVDCVNVLRGGVIDFPELVNGTWRYRVRTNRMVVVIAFGSESHVRIVTAWRM